MILNKNVIKCMISVPSAVSFLFCVPLHFDEHSYLSEPNIWRCLQTQRVHTNIDAVVRCPKEDIKFPLCSNYHCCFSLLCKVETGEGDFNIKLACGTNMEMIFSERIIPIRAGRYIDI